MDIKNKIKTFEDALQATGRPEVPTFSDAPEDLREYFQAQYKAIVITEALSQGREINMSDTNQPKYYPWFDLSGGGFVFDGAYYGYSTAAAGNVSRLCFSSSELAKYAGKQFTEIYAAIIQK